MSEVHGGSPAVREGGGSKEPQSSVQTVRWVAVGSCSALSRSLVHFFISTGDVTAPYQAACTLTIFGDGIEEQSVCLEGARLSQPDGVRLDQAFACLSRGIRGLVGIEIEVTTTQQRVNISQSQCILEILSGNTSVRYRPRRLDRGEQAAAVVHDFMAVEDGVNTSSLVVVNRSATETTFAVDGLPVTNALATPSSVAGQVKGVQQSGAVGGGVAAENLESDSAVELSDTFARPTGTDAQGKSGLAPVFTVRPDRVVEVPLRLNGTSTQGGYCSVDSVRVRTLSGQTPFYFLALRDARSQRITAVSAADYRSVSSADYRSVRSAAVV